MEMWTEPKNPEASFLVALCEFLDELFVVLHLGFTIYFKCFGICVFFFYFTKIEKISGFSRLHCFQ